MIQLSERRPGLLPGYFNRFDTSPAFYPQESELGQTAGEWITDPLGSFQQLQKRMADAVNGFNARRKLLAQGAQRLTAIRAALKALPGSSQRTQLQNEYTSLSADLAALRSEGDGIVSKIADGLNQLSQIAASVRQQLGLGQLQIALVPILVAAVVGAIGFVVAWNLKADSWTQRIDSATQLYQSLVKSGLPAAQAAALEKQILAAGGDPGKDSLFQKLFGTDPLMLGAIVLAVLLLPELVKGFRRRAA